VIRISKTDLAGAAVEAEISALLPQLRAVCIWIRNAEERKHSDGHRKFEDEEGEDQRGRAPMP